MAFRIDPTQLSQVLHFLRSGNTLEGIATFLSTGVTPKCSCIIKRYEQPWEANGHWYPWWQLVAETVITLSLGGFEANECRTDRTLLDHAGPWERPGLMELHKSVSALKKSVPCQELVREFIDQMVAYSNLDEEVILSLIHI